MASLAEAVGRAAIIAIFDARGRILHLNDLGCAVLGCSRGEVIGKGPRRLDAGGRGPGALRECRAALRRDRRWRGEVCLRARGGRLVWIDATVVPCLGARGRPDRFLAVGFEVTERKRLERALRQDVARLEAVLDSSEAVAYLKDLEGRYLLINQRWAALFGVTKTSVVGKTDYDLFPAEIADAFRRNDQRALEAGRAIEMEEIAPHEDGPHTYLTIKAPLFGPGGEPYATCGISTDITQRKRTEEALRQSEERFRRAFESAAIGMALLTPEGRWSRVNRALCEMVGYSQEELLATTCAAITHPEDREVERPVARALLSGELSQYRGEKRYIHKDGHEVWALVSSSVVRDEGGAPVHFVAQIEDITPRKRAEAAVAERARLAELGSEVGLCLTRRGPQREILQQCAEAIVRRVDVALVRIWTLDAGGEVLELRASAGKYTHLDGPHARVPVGSLKIGRIAEECRPCLTNAIVDDPDLSDLEWVRREGMVAFAGYPLLVDGRPLGVLAAFARRPLSDLEFQAMGSIASGLALAIERERAEALLAHQATHDGLTGLPNRCQLILEIEEAVLEARRTGGRCALLLLDLDRFKEINDSFGHHLGDELLKRLNPRLTGVVRPTDRVARLGGDEFGILLPGADEGGALGAADRILAALERPVVVEGKALVVGGSVGIALCPDHGSDAATLLKRADIAMYAAKRGRLGRVLYASELPECTPQRLQLIGDLRRAIEEGRLRLHYQPKVALPTGEVAGVEALVRWNHPTEGLIAPGRFIPLAEQTGMIRPLGRWALCSALRQCRTWREAGIGVGVAVNLSPCNLHDEQLVPTISELLEASGASPGWLTLEVTETAMMEDPAHARRVLELLHEMGIRVSIDDFGTGYSSLAFLKELPVDEVKVDRSFVRDMLGSVRDASIVRAVIDLGHNLGLQVVAEGVEDGETAHQLARWGCDLAQGYHFAPPLPPPRFAAWRAGRFRSGEESGGGLAPLPSSGGPGPEAGELVADSRSGTGWEGVAAQEG
ncbi:bifunctional diguanylate cyclase/phosphodiesterase [Tautonia sociabilis]|uniref:bifunctional diguanylate cyclase/phosphodiesterase n=1 Tax=Tautonia sociabilis TaxID=2080755 RepID=UPI00131590F1|nr:EAL domain-containing protein [Tautonia sociabilis]